MRFIFIILFCGIGEFSGLAQESQVPWAPDFRLEWKDFEGPVNPTSPFSANTSSGISYGWSLKHGGNKTPEFSYRAFAFFVPERSWVKEGKRSPHLLAHEQLHFDITEIHARKLRKALRNFDPVRVKDVKGTVQKIYKRIETESKKMQEQFDLETLHSQNDKAQLKWRERIVADLKALEEFAAE